MSNLRTKVSAVRAQLYTLTGRPRGFFVQYDYARLIERPAVPYAEVATLCEAAPYRSFLGEMQALVPEFLAFGGSPTDPVWGRGMLSVLDGATIYTAVRQAKPKRVIEIGSGDSTHFIAHAAPGAQITCIDPAPRREIDALPVDLIRRVMTVEDADRCEELEAGDILFIDSSHIMLPGMDVDIQFNRCFPRLKRGVLVHIHDIFLPFDYPPHWHQRQYSEQNALIGWIVSGFFDVVFPAHYVARRHGELVREKLQHFSPLKQLHAGSLWLRKT